MIPERAKVLYLDGSIGFGGAIKSLALMLRGLRGIEPIVVTPQVPAIVERWLAGWRVYTPVWLFNYRRRARLAERLARSRLPRPIRVAVLRAYGVGRHVEQAGAIVRVLALAKYHRVDVIHLNTGFNNAWGGLRAARLLGLPCVVHMRGIFEPRTRSVARGMHHATHVIAVSDAVAASLTRHGVPADRVTTVYDPVDLMAFEGVAERRAATRRELGLADGDLAVGIFGRVIAWKGQREFVEAMLVAVQEEPRLKAIVVGDESDGSLGYLDAIKARIAASGHGGRFVLAGYREDVERFYAAMDVVVHASITPEPFGMVVAEAMAARRPVIASDAGGPSEVVTPGVEGLLVAPGDVGRLAGAILRLARDPEARRHMGEAGYRKVSRDLTVAHTAMRAEAVYRTVLAGSAERAPRRVTEPS